MMSKGTSSERGKWGHSSLILAMPSKTDYNGNTTFYTYDEQGHIIRV